MKTKGSSPKPWTSKATYMRDEAFADLEQALEDALAFERGERRDLDVTQIEGSRLPKTSRKVAIPKKLNQSQP